MGFLCLYRDKNSEDKNIFRIFVWILNLLTCHQQFICLSHMTSRFNLTNQRVEDAPFGSVTTENIYLSVL